MQGLSLVCHRCSRQAARPLFKGSRGRECCGPWGSRTQMSWGPRRWGPGLPCRGCADARGLVQGGSEAGQGQCRPVFRILLSLPARIISNFVFCFQIPAGCQVGMALPVEGADSWELNTPAVAGIRGPPVGCEASKISTIPPLLLSWHSMHFRLYHVHVC